MKKKSKRNCNMRAFSYSSMIPLIQISSRRGWKKSWIHSTLQYAHLFWIIENVDFILQFRFNDATREIYEIYNVCTMSIY